MRAASCAVDEGHGIDQASRLSDSSVSSPSDISHQKITALAVVRAEFAPALPKMCTEFEGIECRY